MEPAIPKDNDPFLEEGHRYASMPDIWAAEPIEKGYDTPAYDSLKNQWQVFIISYLKCNDKRQAAIEAGYKPATAAHRGWTLARRPDIIEAIKELVNREMLHAEQQRCQVIVRLTADSMVSLEDLTEWSEDDQQFKLKAARDVAPAYRRSIGLASMSREGFPVFNNTAQNASRKLLASYMKWDREEAHAAPPITFDFSGLKGTPDSE
jgi:hypothetical protein|tara:strand:- start:776 stop:1396 length:621 start_codon:yes stop_codon:yes gene_type:complete